MALLLPSDRTTAVDPASLVGLTVPRASRHLAQAFAAAGVDQPDLDARILVAAALRVDAVALLRTPERVVSAPEAAQLAAWSTRRIAREPVSRLLGQRGFYGRDFEITPATLDPRPDSEVLIDAALAFAIATSVARGGLTILDIGTGSGCLLVTLLAELASARGCGVDISSDALACAARNADHYNVADRALWVRADGPGAAPRSFDIVIANPPYIPSGDIASLDAEVAVYDPHAALDGGSDGLSFYRAWIAALPAVLRPGGLALFEIGSTQADAVTTIVGSHGGDASTASIEILNDLAGRPRCVAVRSRRS